MTRPHASVQGFVTPNLSAAIPAPAPYDSEPENRIATLTTTANYVLFDLLLSKVLVAPEDGLNTASPWQPVSAVGRIEVGRPALFRLASYQALATSPVTAIEWLGPQQHIDPRDIEAMKIIGDMLTKPPIRKHWWQRA